MQEKIKSMDDGGFKKYNSIFIFIYAFLFLIGIKTLFHGFPDTERFFAEWMDERLTLTAIMKFGNLNFVPTIIWHPPLYHYLTFIPISLFFLAGKFIGLFRDKAEFVRFYFNNTHYFFLIGRAMSYVFYWSAAIVIFRIARLFSSRVVSHITVLAYLLLPRFIFDFSTTRPETLLFLNASLCFLFFLKYYLNARNKKYLFLSTFFLGISAATKYNALYLAAIFISLFAIQLADKSRNNKNLSDKQFLPSWGLAGFLALLGFFICDPYFLIQFDKYFYNLKVYNMEMKYYWKQPYPTILGLKHLRELVSFMYMNFFGFLILCIGVCRLFGKDKRLFSVAAVTILTYEIYFGIYLKDYSPLRYLNPLLPLAALLFSMGAEFILKRGKKLAVILVLCGGILIFNYFYVWQDLSLGQTHTQRARAFIEKNIPEFTTICIASNNYLPQLNMTRESYSRLMKTAPVCTNIAGHELVYKAMDSEENYNNIYRELRIESLMKKPQYNLIRWDDSIDNENDALNFLKKNKIEYLISNDPFIIGGRKIEDMKIASSPKEFKRKNNKIYEFICAGTGLFLYKVNR